jgi:polyisoprenoid-binding protein YceI
MRQSMLALITLLSLPALAQTSKWDFDSENSSAEFVCKHVLVTNVRGMVHNVSGTDAR